MIGNASKAHPSKGKYSRTSNNDDTILCSQSLIHYILSPQSVWCDKVNRISIHGAVAVRGIFHKNL